MGRLTPHRWSNFNGYRGRTVSLPDGRTTTVYEHREVMEAILGRALLPGEHVHHRDGNRANNAPDNLELLTAAEHAHHHNPELPPLTLTCIRCGASFTRDRHWERSNRKRGKSGPFCGKRCAGSWSREQQIARGQVDLGGGRPRGERGAS